MVKIALDSGELEWIVYQEGNLLRYFKSNYNVLVGFSEKDYLRRVDHLLDDYNKLRHKGVDKQVAQYAAMENNLTYMVQIYNRLHGDEK